MNKQTEEKRELVDILYWSGYGFDRGTCNDLARQIYEQGYRRQEDVAREIFEELSATIMPLVESHNKIAENTGDIVWGHKADGLETALLALKGIIRKYGVKEE